MATKMTTKLVVRVKATAVGFYGQMRKPGDIFNVTESHRQASWYVPVDMLGQLTNSETVADGDLGSDEDDELNFDEDGEDLVGD